MYIKTLLIILALASLACVQSAALPRTTPEAGTTAPVTALSPTRSPICAQTTTALHLRAMPNANAGTLDWLSARQIVTVRSKLQDWWLITAGERTGFARAKYLQETECG